MTSLPTTDYHVHLDAFEGPLDLLLFLIRRAEVEVTDIPIAQIADQYLDYLQHIDTIDIDRAGEFLVMAATLTEIKARMLAPAPRSESESSAAARPEFALIDPRAELIRQLLDYKKFRDAARALDRRRAEWDARFPAARVGIDREALAEAAAAAAGENEGGLDLDDVTLADLADAFARILDTVDFNRLGEHHITVDETPIELHAADIIDRLQREVAAAAATPAPSGIPFAAIFAGRTRSEMIGLFLAMLELTRQRRIRVRQDALHGQILLTLTSPEEIAAAEAVPGESAESRPAQE